MYECARCQMRTFEEWCAAYPVRAVDTPPAHFRYLTNDHREAERLREGIEEADEVAAEVVQHATIFYVIYKVAQQDKE
jgi:hypothetical protein